MTDQGNSLEERTYAADMLIRHYLVDTAGADLTSVRYLPEAILPQDGTQGMMAPPPIIISPAAMATATAALDALPNPARQEAVFRYRLPEAGERGRITVTDMDGRTVASFMVEGESGHGTQQP